MLISECSSNLLRGIMMKLVCRLLFGLHVFVGIGAMAGGFAAIINPQKPLGMSAVYLKN